MFTVILVLRCATGNNTYGVVAETNTSVMENNDTQKVSMSAQATTTDNQANNIKDDYASTITEVLISGTANTYETILHI